MNLFRTTAAVLALTTGLLALPAQAEMVPQNASGDPLYTVEAPKGYAMAGDLLIARPLLIAGTVIGAGLFVISAPFTLAGGNFKESAKSLVGEPAMAAFVRCLGCTESGYKRD
ncbi:MULTISPECIES: multidrug transporter [unclassified Pseudomonas]|uniref:multidrug transporter n=1 Tax=unclassified Pseudomonas TaxID=196821 RepID=UPI00244A4964|nr:MULTISPECIES: multidrug transporter [unclassified Pseudomonas]MDH0897486.1 multidrug transporter [Pseudomonas sp. GD03875]MDH1067447.1 multidrug transporter [Pseudomonas sp. GD03985]